MPATVARSGRRRTISEINMVPFIDVMLVLLIIFMVTAPLITPSLIDLPSAGRAARTPDRIVQVQIGKDEKITVKSLSARAESRAAAIETIASVVRDAQAGDAQVPVVISADRNLRYEQVVRVMDALQRAGIARIGLAVQPAP